ncbi:hypothetical protein B0H19DRAFT_1253179 [Mycena capillaripes]|nr:hypothetical protein B0H19DRAFT_1253179 [Mycena capillaripes]
MLYDAAHITLPGMYTALIDPVRWNSDWEKITNQVQQDSPEQFVRPYAIQLATESNGMDVPLIRYQRLLGNLAGLQLSITQDATRYFARDDLEKRWMNASPVLRGKHVLIGLSNACSIARNLHDTCMYCGREKEQKDIELKRLRDVCAFADIVRG